MGEFKYSEWDGSQNLFDMDADELMDKVSNDIMSNSSLSDIMRRMMRNGMQDRQGRPARYAGNAPAAAPEKAGET